MYNVVRGSTYSARALYISRAMLRNPQPDTSGDDFGGIPALVFGLLSSRRTPELKLKMNLGPVLTCSQNKLS